MWLKVKNSIALNILLLIAAVWVGYGTYTMISQAFSLRKESLDRQKKTSDLVRKKAELEAYIAELQSKEAIEREAKKRLNLKIPGEKVVVVVPDKNVSEQDLNKKNIWERMKSLFANFFNR